MKPEEFSQSLRKAYDTADAVYQSATRADRPLEAQPHKKPWLAALMSFLIVGSGQLYNQQYVRAFLLFVFFYVGGAVVTAVFFLFHWLLANEAVVWSWAVVVARYGFMLRDSFILIWATIWVTGILHAYLTAKALRDGKLFIRYGLGRQLVFAICQLVPVASALVPSETVPDNGDPSLAAAATDAVREHAVKRLLWFPLKATSFLFGILLIAVGMALEIAWLVTVGGLLCALAFAFILI
ncbi:MAG: hypothetical protein KatS3mg105_3946 [Gemmatales bacterium]|nr:MAG: hypothetical protein KatS3mg105_3946 [Gemmatales bacterium]